MRLNSDASLAVVIPVACSRLQATDNSSDSILAIQSATHYFISSHRFALTDRTFLPSERRGLAARPSRPAVAAGIGCWRGLVRSGAARGESHALRTPHARKQRPHSALGGNSIPKDHLSLQSPPRNQPTRSCHAWTSSPRRTLTRRVTLTAVHQSPNRRCDVTKSGRGTSRFYLPFPCRSAGEEQAAAGNRSPPKQSPPSGQGPWVAGTSPARTGWGHTRRRNGNRAVAKCTHCE